jgi:pyridoxine 4-dehydrogenase
MSASDDDSLAIGDTHMPYQTEFGGDFTFPTTSLTVRRIGYGAMQLAGPHVFGPPTDRSEAIAVLREAIASGINHIDTSDFYGPHITNQVIREALHPYPEDLTLVTKVGYRRGDDGSWIVDRSREYLVESVQNNLRNLGLGSLKIVNLRVGGPFGPEPGSLADPLKVLIELKEQGLIHHIGLSNITPEQFAEAQTLTEIVCIQNFYNLANRGDDAFIDDLAKRSIAYVPYFPLGGFNPLQSSTMDTVAASLGVTPMQVAQAWLLHRSPNILLIAGTSRRTHLRENLSVGKLRLPPEVMTQLDTITDIAK